MWWLLLKFDNQYSNQYYMLTISAKTKLHLQHIYSTYIKIHELKKYLKS